jgi:hypothetical protein
VVAGFTVAGFSWLTGYHLLIERYYQGVASERAYGYWAWANLAVMTVAAGPAAAVILRRAALSARQAIPARQFRTGNAGWVLVLAAAAAIMTADLSGYSKAEVERIWLPFAVWLTAGAGLIPQADRRTWLAVQAGVALVVNHLVLTVW